MYLDICKAFDCVNHELLLQKLKEVGITGSCKAWLCNFLTNRTQYVVNQGMRSMPARVNTGIPQGSNLGPTLFLVYVNDMCCMGLRSTVIQFADDTVVYYSDKKQDVDVGNLILNASQIEYVEKYDYLGVTIETDLKFKRHIEKSFTRINNKLYVFTCMRKSMNTKAAVMVYKSMVLPFLEYGNVFLSTCTE